jgi:eukaryotic-like serine/threonine-protein kinase
MPNTWKQWEGQTLNEKFPLLRYLGGSENSGVFLTERPEGDRKANAAIRIFHPESGNGEEKLSRWQEASKLSHPNLIQLYEMGRFELEGSPFIYAVMECADENLAQVLPSRALTTDEARATLESVLGVLAYLHRKGFVHGRITPANIMAAGDQLKLSSDELRRVGEPLAGKSYADAYESPESTPGVFPMAQSVSPAVDAWSLGITLVQTLTQDLPVLRAAEQKDPLVPETLPQPFRDIASHCLVRHPQNRWTVDQIAARLEGRMPVEQTPRPQAQARPSVPKPKIAAPRVEIPQPAPVPVRRPSSRPAISRSYAVPAAVGFAFVLAAFFVVPKLARQHPDGAPVPAAESEAPATPRAPASPAPLNEPPPIKSAKSTNSRNSEFDSAESMPKVPVATPAVIHPESMRDEETNTVARTPVGSAVRGEVAHREMPEVLQSATNSIRGTVRVRVKVNVDRAGNVEDAELESRGPSRYFSRAAVQAAQRWKFKPPTVGGKGVLSSWILQFDFTRGETMVVPTQEMP